MPTTDALEDGQSASESPPNSEAIRREHLTMETCIHAVGLFYFIAGCLVWWIDKYAGSSVVLARTPGYLIAFGGVLQLLVGFDLRRNRRWAQVAGILLALYGMAAFPYLAPFGLLILWLLLNRKARMVFSKSYRKVISATPDMIYTPSRTMWWIFNVTLVLFFGAMMAILSL